jgi:tetratricopeptide (TPR) repeat protein
MADSAGTTPPAFDLTVAGSSLTTPPAPPSQGGESWPTPQQRNECRRNAALLGWIGVLVFVAALGLLWAGWKWWTVLRDRAALAEVKEAIEANRHQLAERKLAALLASNPDADEALYLSGICEQARGRLDAAAKAWNRIRPGSAFFVPAIIRRAEFLTQLGRFADAEEVIQQALLDLRIDRSPLRWFLVPLYAREGRALEAMRLIEDNWDLLDRSADDFLGQTARLLKTHSQLSLVGPPVEGIRSYLEKAAQLAPEDDRVWLGIASIAIREGAFDEAKRRLDACLLKRPADVSVWKVYLQWAVATDQVAEAQTALRRIPAEAASPAMVHQLAARLAAKRGDVAEERRALERLVSDAPCDNSAWSRLTELANLAGEPARAVDLQQKKTNIDAAKDRYQILFRRNQPTRDAAEMVHLAERLGLWFEARVYLTVAALVDPRRPVRESEMARLKARGIVEAPGGLSLADFLALERNARATGLEKSPAAASMTRQGQAAR